MIKAHQNIPVLSYLLLGGRCASCQRAHLRALSGRRAGDRRYCRPPSPGATAGTGRRSLPSLFTWALIALTVIDYDHQILPDAITLPLLWLGLLLALAWHPGLRPTIPVDPASAIAGAVAGYLVLWLVYWAFKLVTGKEGMGYGDFKLLAAFGAWMGWQMLPLIILLSALTGAVARPGADRAARPRPAPPDALRPFLALAGWIAMMWGPQIVGGYLPAMA